MKRIAYMGVILALLVFSGCSSKEPTIDATKGGSAIDGGSINQMPTTQKASADTGAVIAPITTASSMDANVNGSTNANGSAQQGIVSIYFDYDKFDIREDMQGSLKANGNLVKNKTFKLEGNCDEFGSDEYNFALGLKRANSVKSALVDSGVSADAISMTSLGEGNPVCSEKTQECWAKNRRVDFKLP
jgi:peptidoglycan-associated lipoprotein